MTRTLTQLLERLWDNYSSQNPQVKEVYDLLLAEGETIVNDHIALRTFDHPKIDIYVLAKPLLALGYQEGGSYEFEEKKLFAKHYSHPNKDYPRIFISMLQAKFFSPFLNELLETLVAQIPSSILGTTELLHAGRPWQKINYSHYRQLKSESEYASWLYVNGFCANHFTVSINALNKYNDIYILNEFLKAKGFVLNESNGEVKGSPQELLEQSSTMAGKMNVEFEEGVFLIPSFYYEFAKRYPDKEGRLYDGFIARSADKIFESTED